MKRLADLRPGLSTMDEARASMEDIANLVCTIELHRARAEQRIAAIKSQLLADITEWADDLRGAEAALKTFIETHTDLFQKPRKVKTEFGSFGLQAVNEVVIEAEQKALQYITEHKLEDCFELNIRPVKAGIKDRIEAGETIPGCTIKTGDTAVYKVDKALIDRAREDA